MIDKEAAVSLVSQRWETVNHFLLEKRPCFCLVPNMVMEWISFSGHYLFSMSDIYLHLGISRLSCQQGCFSLPQSLLTRSACRTLTCGVQVHSSQGILPLPR